MTFVTTEKSVVPGGDEIIVVVTKTTVVPGNNPVKATTASERTATSLSTLSLQCWSTLGPLLHQHQPPLALALAYL